MNKKVLIIFLVVIAIFVSYFLITKSDDSYVEKEPIESVDEIVEKIEEAIEEGLVQIVDEVVEEVTPDNISEVEDPKEKELREIQEALKEIREIEKEKKMNAKPVEKTEEQKLCEEYGGEWLSKEISEIGDACEFIYLSVGNLWYHELYFDGDEPNEEFYLQHEEDQKRIIMAKNHTSSLEEEYKKEINVAKKYCKEVEGRFIQGVTSMRDSVLESLFHYWTVRCYIE